MADGPTADLSELLRESSKDAREVFGRLYLLCQPRVERLVAAKLGCRVETDAVQEVTQTVFVTAWDKRDQLRDDFFPWLLSTARSQVEEYRRKRSRAPAALEPSTPDRRPDQPSAAGELELTKSFFAALTAFRVALDALEPTLEPYEPKRGPPRKEDTLRKFVAEVSPEAARCHSWLAKQFPEFERGAESGAEAPA